MPQTHPEQLAIRSETDIVLIRQITRARSKELELSLIDQTKLVTAASELARNTLDHGGGGSCRIDVAEENGRVGLRLCFEDAGPGIDNLDQALDDGFTSGGGLGLGLGGTRRLVHEFDIRSQPGEGTRVEIIRWRG